MQLILCVILSSIICNFKAESSAISVAQKLENTNDDDYKVNFTDLDDDCMFLILEHSDLGDLLNVAQINEKISAVAANVFRRKYSHLQILLIDNMPYSSALQFMFNDQERSNSRLITTNTIERICKDQSYRLYDVNAFIEHNLIRFRDYHAILNLFKHFGREIKKVQFEIRIPNIEAKLFAYLINEYSSESLVDIELGQGDSVLLNRVKKPLVKVENVEFSNNVNGLGTIPTARISDQFPAVRRLHVARFSSVPSISSDQFSYFDHHMPHLEHITMYFDSIQGVITKNPQIRSVDLGNFYPESLQKLSTILPQLETLALRGLRGPAEESIRFEHVTTYKIEYPSSPVNLHFPRLRSLHVSGIDLDKRFHEYLAFLNEHNHLTQLHFMQVENLRDFQFDQLTANLTDLVKLTLKQSVYIGSNEMTVNAIVTFIEKHDKVMKINFIDFRTKWTQDLQLNDEWNRRIIKETRDFSSLSFERK